jgi:hypothetical protein
MPVVLPTASRSGRRSLGNQSSHPPEHWRHFSRFCSSQVYAIVSVLRPSATHVRFPTPSCTGLWLTSIGLGLGHCMLCGEPRPAPERLPDLTVKIRTPANGEETDVWDRLDLHMTRE